MTLTIHLQDARWRKAFYPYRKNIEKILAVISPPLRGERKRGANAKQPAPSHALPLKGEGDVAIVLADDDFIQRLNHQYRGKNKATNVLSFPNEEESLGDIILAYETIEQEALTQGKDFKDHATHLIIHGILHLMGYDHENDEDAARMEAKEIKYLKQLGIKNPYL